MPRISQLTLRSVQATDLVCVEATDGKCYKITAGSLGGDATLDPSLQAIVSNSGPLDLSGTDLTLPDEFYLPASVVLSDQSNTFTTPQSFTTLVSVGVANSNGGVIQLFNEDSAHHVTLSAPTVTASRGIILPDASGTIALTTAQTFTGAQVFSGGLTVSGLGSTNFLIIDGGSAAPGGLLLRWTGATTQGTSIFPGGAGTFSVSLPAANTALVGTDVTQTLTGKTLNGENNTISNATHRALFEDRKATGASGDAITAGGWRTVTLNTEVYDTSSGFSVSGNVITVGASGAGGKFVRASVPLYGTSSARTRLRRTNNTAATLAAGSAEYSWNANYVVSRSEINAFVTLTAGDTLELQVWCQTNGSVGYNSDVATGEIAVFSQLEFFTR